MKHILLICSAGMSTSMLVTRMQKAAETRGVDAKIWAMGATEAKGHLDEADIILLGPQVRFMKAEISSKTTKPVDVIDMSAYGMMNGEKVLEAALKVLAK
ncbi:MAG: PTS sugar transporter subunit IIB [Erysipelotrichaceae bacterium]